MTNRIEWLEQGRSWIGLKEIPGPQNNPTIIKWLVKLKAWWQEDETPWCGTFVAHCFDVCNIAPASHWYRAKDWLNWGIVVAPRVGTVAVFNRGGGGHVGFIVGESATHYAVLGGNQNNAVNIMNIEKNRLLGCRWPVGVAKPLLSKLPKIAALDGNGNEA